MNCPICKRKVSLTKHHLIPKVLHKRFKKKKKKYNLKETIDICNDCHNQLHKVFTVKELALNINTLELIINNEKVKKFARFVIKTNKNQINMKTGC